MEKENTDYLTPEDFDRLISCIPKLEVYHKTWQTGKGGGVVKSRPALSPKQFQLLFKLSYYCALRINEALQLTKKDFDLENKEVRIYNKSKNITEYTTVPSIIIDELRTYLTSLENENLLFNVTRSTAWRYAKDAANDAGLKLFKRRKEMEIKGAYTKLFRDSLKRNMRINGADDDLVNLKLRITSDNYGLQDLNSLKNWEEKIQKTRFLSEDEIKNDVEWYKERFEIYKKLSDAVKKIIDEILDTKKIEVHYTESRPKTISEFEKKIRRGVKYDPKNMQDLAGIRVICFVKADVDLICEIIEKTFDVIARLSMDKSKILGENKMGYRSIHYVAKLPKERVQLEEMKKFEGLIFEIQVRTILQHAWAEIEHDRLYKYGDDLSTDTARRFYLISSLLESADNEFQRLHDIEEEYSQK